MKNVIRLTVDITDAINGGVSDFEVVLKNNGGGVTEDVPTPKAPKADKPTKTVSTPVTSADDVDYDSMTGKALYELCIERGIKVPKHGKAKGFYIDALNAHEGDTDEVEETEEIKAASNEDLSAKELYELCIEKGLKVPARKPKAFYLDKLAEADTSVDEDDTDWDEEEEVEEAPKKKAPKNKKSTTKKVAKKEVEEDEDEDWEI